MFLSLKKTLNIRLTGALCAISFSFKYIFFHYYINPNASRWKNTLLKWKLFSLLFFYAPALQKLRVLSANNTPQSCVYAVGVPPRTPGGATITLWEFFHPSSGWNTLRTALCSGGGRAVTMR